MWEGVLRLYMTEQERVVKMLVSCYTFAEHEKRESETQSLVGERQ